MTLNTSGSQREQFENVEPEARRALIDNLVTDNVLVGDPRRWRPRWFDGRFLAASDLLAEQNYFLVRQADLGRAGGSGIVVGLDVSFVDRPGTGSDQLRISPGHGMTDTGEIVALFDPLTFNPADVPEMRRIDAAFGLQVIPNEPGRTRTGIYILALRPVEWTANPIGAYPTSLTGKRTVEDGTIVEGVAVSFVPYPDIGNEETWALRRARVAQEIFVEGRDRGLDSGVLPLAMLALRGNLVEWVDPFMVRRETGAERPAGMDFGFGARALREAHLLQYQRHLADAFNASRDRPFAATTWFMALPPVGQFPSATIDANRLTQRFFPPGIDVDISFLPEDELPAVIEESLMLPPIDLTLSVKELIGTGVVVLVPLKRATFNTNRGALPNREEQPPELAPGFVDLKAEATPKQRLLAQNDRQRTATTATSEEESWQEFLRAALVSPLLWYVRRRHLPIVSNVNGTSVDASNVTDADPARLADLAVGEPLLGESLERLRASGIPEAEVLSIRIASSAILDRPSMPRSLLAEAGATAQEPLEAHRIASALASATDPNLGMGLDRLSGVRSTLGRRLEHNAVTDTGLVPEIDRLAREVPKSRLEEFSNMLGEVLGVRGNPPPNLAKQLVAMRKEFTSP